MKNVAHNLEPLFLGTVINQDAELKTRLARLNKIQDTSPGAHQERIFPSRGSPTFPTGKARNFHLQQAQGRGSPRPKSPSTFARKPALQRCLRPVATERDDPDEHPATRLYPPAVTNARFATLHGLPVGPVPLSTTPVPLLKPCARHERHSHCAATAAGFRLRLGGGVALRLRFARRSSPPALHFPARRPQTEAGFKEAFGQTTVLSKGAQRTQYPASESSRNIPAIRLVAGTAR